MTTSIHNPYIVRLFCYPIASADMYYSVENEREVYISDDPVYGFRVWGEIIGVGEKSSVGLCEIFFEYAMSCMALHNLPLAQRYMESFGKRLGKLMARYIKSCPPMQARQNLGMFALDCVMQAMEAHSVVEPCESGSSYYVKNCPICLGARRKGLPYADLVHEGIYKLCRSLIQDIDPYLSFYAPTDSETDHTFFVAKQVLA
jgi:hypothetical protein